MRPEKQYELTEDDTTTFFDNGSFFLATCLVSLSSLKVSTEDTNGFATALFRMTKKFHDIGCNLL